MESTSKAIVRQVYEQARSVHVVPALDVTAAADAVDKALMGMTDGNAKAAFDLVMARRAGRIRRHAEAASFCESPIEKALLAALLECGFVPGTGPFESIAYNPVGSASLYAQRETSAGGKSYRLDFSVECPGIRIAVECDGHDFHERTKEQARHDRSRDRALTLAGWTVLRFTGSEIHADAIRCASDVIRAAKCDTPKGRPPRMDLRELAAKTTEAMKHFGPVPRF